MRLMLTIRRVQLETLAAPQRETFVGIALRSLAKLFPDDARLADEKAMRALIHDAISRANEYDLARERELLLFIYLVFDQGPGFESRQGQSWIERLLRDSSLEESEKMDVIYTRLELASRGGRP
ncbi:hypothetical protein [Pyxidicoccus trucidator]|uniref:hypothetical protein n=1 Tax=Pyxidicoccus trucidator TaxID=2709662 RepID=UPI001967D0EC|nr:hypothetical protein [Pyxidicoccus trucidator]